MALAAAESKNSKNVLRVSFGVPDRMANRLEAITATNGAALWYKSLLGHSHSYDNCLVAQEAVTGRREVSKRTFSSYSSKGHKTY
jgi:hypothetical protein